MHLVGYLYEDYHDAWSLEHKKPVISVVHLIASAEALNLIGYS
jgi:hypothetical protein